MCHSMSEGRIIFFELSSCVRFSPNLLSPHAYASLIASAGKFLLTATSFTSSGLRPADAIVSLIDERILSTFSLICFNVFHPLLFFCLLRLRYGFADARS